MVSKTVFTFGCLFVTLWEETKCSQSTANRINKFGRKLFGGCLVHIRSTGE